MSPEDKRVAIALACDYKWFTTALNREQKVLARSQAEADTATLGKWIWSLTPDYLSCLNAMHEAEKVLTPHQAEEYTMRLARMLLNEASSDLLTYDHTANWYNIFVLLNATPSQRADAFLLTLGLMEADKP